jgi:hypothetical protein
MSSPHLKLKEITANRIAGALFLSTLHKDSGIFHGKTILQRAKAIRQRPGSWIDDAMNKHQMPVYEMFCNVRGFVRNHNELFARGSNAGNIAVRLDEIIQDLDKHILLQSTSDHESQKCTKDKSKASDELRNRLQLIVDIARLLKRTIPDIMDRFKFSKGESDAALLHTARSFAEQAEPLKHLFTKYEMPQDFVADLNVRIRNIEQLLADRTAAKSAVKGSTNNITIGIKQGLHVVAELDVIMTNLLGNSSPMLSQWRFIRHVRKVPRSKRISAGQDNAD